MCSGVNRRQMASLRPGEKSGGDGVRRRWRAAPRRWRQAKNTGPNPFGSGGGGGGGKEEEEKDEGDEEEGEKKKKK